jgi:ATP synthase protein I
MSEKNQRHQLQDKVDKQASRLTRAERERHQWLAQTVYIGTLGLVFIIPMVGGAYLGAWLDRRLEGYSTSWTLSLILLGLVVGAVNVYLMMRE